VVQTVEEIPPLTIQPTSINAPQVPNWIKNTAKWWSEGQVGDSDFLKGIGYLVQNNIIQTTPTQTPTNPNLPSNPTPNMTCPLGQTFNSQTNLCETHQQPSQPLCPAGTTYDQKTNQCVTNQKSNQPQCPIGQTYNSQTNLCVDICPSGQTYDPKTTSCLSNQNQSNQPQCPYGTTYDPKTNQCIK
jgi:hypothetical protein